MLKECYVIDSNHGFDSVMSLAGSRGKTIKTGRIRCLDLQHYQRIFLTLPRNRLIENPQAFPFLLKVTRCFFIGEILPTKHGIQIRIGMTGYFC